VTFSDRPSFGLYIIAIAFAMIAGFGWLQGDNEQLIDEIFLAGSWVLSLNSIVGFNFKNGFSVNRRRRKSAHVEKFLIALSVLATALYVIGNFVLSPMVATP